MFAVNHIKVDWNKEAVESAKSYLEMSAFSRASLIQQSSSKAGDKYTLAQAAYAANRAVRLYPNWLSGARFQVWRESWAVVREGTMGLFGKRETAVGRRRATIRCMTARKQ